MHHHPIHPAHAPVPLRHGDALIHPPAVPEPRSLPAEMPPGIQLVTLPDGTRTLAYTPLPEALPAPGIPRWAKTTALLTPAIGGGIAATGIGISYAAPGLAALSHALWAVVALIATGAAVTFARPRRAAARPTTHITQHITATGWFGKATGTIHHR